MVDGFRLLFSALDTQGTVQLWATDGTLAGTGELTAVANDWGGLYPERITVFNPALASGRAALAGLDADGKASLWATDGTADGTHELLPASAFSEGLNPRSLVALGPSILFTGTNTDGRSGLWITDGSDAGTMELLQLPAGPSIANPQAIVWNGLAWFEIAGHLVVSDGSMSGTQVLATGLAGNDAGSTLAGFDAGVLFSASGQLWRSDGTVEGTTAVTDIATASTTLAPADLVSLNGSVLFRGIDARGNTQLWASDGTSLAPLTGFASGASTSYPLGITALGDGAIFFARGPDGTQQLWGTDGTPDGTSEIVAINDTAPASLTVAGGMALFTTTGGLWRTDGTASGTARISSGPFDAGTSLPDGTVLFATPGMMGAIVVAKPILGGISTLIPAAYANDLTPFSAGTPPLTNTTPPPCFLPGTRILTDTGEVAVEALYPGQRVLTCFGGWQTLRWIGQGRMIVGAAHDHPARPVIIDPGALGEGVPSRPLRVTQGHCLHFPGDGLGMLVPAALLVNGRSIRLEDAVTEVTYFHIALDRHDIVLAEGAACETWHDDGETCGFSPAPPVGTGPPCAPKQGYGAGSIAIWQALRRRAGLAPPADAIDPDVHLLADGRPVAPDFRRGACYRFTLKRRPLDLRLRSRSAVPAEAGIGPDLRRLGVGLHEIQLAQRGTLRHLPIDHPALGDGLHPPDPAGGPRWTMGSARFDTTRLRLDRGPLRVQVTVTPLAFYPVS